MRVRIVISGILAGLICLVPLYIQFYTLETAAIVPGWSRFFRPLALPDWFTAAVFIVCGLTLFAFGWVAARWNWAEDWKDSVFSGLGMGVIAGCLIFDFIGVFWFSVLGQAEVLENYFIQLTEAEGMRILLESIAQTGTFIFLNFAKVVLACAVLGGIGGLASAVFDVKDVWGNSPRKPEGWLFRSSAYFLTISGIINMILVIAVYSILWEKLTESITKADQDFDIQWSLDFNSALFYLYAYLVSLAFIFIPTGLTWGWTFRTWWARKKIGILSILWLAGSAYEVFSTLVRYLLNGSIFALPLDLLALVVVLVLGVVLGLTMQDDSEGFPYQFSDYAGFALTCGIIGGTQFVIGVLGYSFAVVLITIVNIPHLTLTGLVDQLPAEQVVALYNMQSLTAAASIIICAVAALLAVTLTSFLRTVIGVRELSAQPELEMP